MLTVMLGVDLAVTTQEAEVEIDRGFSLRQVVEHVRRPHPNLLLRLARVQFRLPKEGHPLHI